MEPLEKIKLACQIILKFKLRNTLTIDYPFEISWLENATEEELLETYREITDDSYMPDAAETVDVPKTGALIRHFSYLSLKDHLLYIILGFECFPAIYKTLNDKSDEEAIRAIKQYPFEYKWLKKYIRGDKDMMDMRKPLYNKGYMCILTSDITAFAPNIDIHLLCSSLAAAGAPAATLKRLEKCLRRWSPLGHKGLPQVYFTTDILTEFYLHPVDRYFQNYGGLVYLRESDNIEIWCRSKASCRKMLALLAGKMYERGLYLNVNKTKILNERSIDKTTHPMEHKKYGLRNTIKIRLNRFLKFYYQLLEFTGITDCSRRLAVNPEYTVALLQHYTAANIDISKSLINFFTSGNAIYAYQNYALLKWLYANYQTDNMILFELIRQYAWNDIEPYYVRSAARQYIYKYGNRTDRERLQNQLAKTKNQLEAKDLQSLLGQQSPVLNFIEENQ